jgi:outer membrane autotransporter protein
MSAKRFLQGCAQVVVLLILSMPVANAQLASSFAKMQYGQSENQAAQNSPRFQIKSIRQYLEQLRLLGSPTVPLAQKIGANDNALPSSDALATGSDARKPETGGGAAADKPDSFTRWGAFLNGDYEDGRQTSTDELTGFKNTTKGVTVGADYRFPNNNVLGAAVAYAKADTDLADSGGNQTAKGYGFSVFGTFVPTTNAYIDGILNFGHNKYDGSRKQLQDGFATHHTNGDQWGLAVNAGYQFNRGPLALTPYGRVEYIDAKVDGYDENGNSQEALTIGEQRIKATTLTVGGQVSYSLSTSWGVLLPNARIEFQHVADRNIQNVTASLPGNPIFLPITIPILGEDRTFGNFALGVSGVFPRGVSAFFNYEQLFGKDNFSDRHYSLGLRIEF